MRKIVISHGIGVKIAKVMGCRPEAVSMALNFRRNDTTSRKIRKVAVEQFGGVEIHYP